MSLLLEQQWGGQDRFGQPKVSVLLMAGGGLRFPPCSGGRLSSSMAASSPGFLIYPQQLPGFPETCLGPDSEEEMLWVGTTGSSER